MELQELTNLITRKHFCFGESMSGTSTFRISAVRKAVEEAILLGFDEGRKSVSPPTKLVIEEWNPGKSLR